MPDRDHIADIGRFGLDKPNPPRKGPSASTIQKARARFKAKAGARIRSSASGGLVGVVGVLSPPRSGSPELIASSFLEQNRDTLGIDPAKLQLKVKKSVAGLTHLLYQQTFNDLPVEFSRVKVHLSGQGEVLGVDSGYVPNINASAVASVSQARAAAAVGADLGKAVRAAGSLVYLPVYKTGEIRLAWKFHVSGDKAVWDYYVDAQTGVVLFRTNSLTYATTGTVLGNVYDLDPSTTPNLVDRPMPYQRVYVFNDPGGVGSTLANGTFSSATDGKIVARLSGSFVGVAHFSLPSALYDNGGGISCSAPTPVSSPHPYSGGTAFPNSVVFSATVNVPSLAGTPCAGQTVVALRPHFSAFNVGIFDASVGIPEDDQLRILNRLGEPLASYIGNKGAFVGPDVIGKNPPYSLNLFAAPGDSQYGFDIDVSTALVLTNSPATTGPGNVAGAGTNLTWYSTMTADGSEDEIMVYYHINLMHDFFANGVDAGGAADISTQFPAMVRVGPNMANAFYDPDHDSIFFGDASNGAFALDGTVIHHEYVHRVVSKIYPVFNFGQAGALSEAVADFFATSSLNTPNMGAFVGGSFTSEGSLRNLDCGPNPALCQVFPGQWTGEIHHDDLPVSQALWEIRQAAPPTCADQLVFQSMFFFPDGFQEFLDAMLQVDARGATLAPACGGNGAQNGTILAKFAAHGITNLPPGSDAYEPNDGPETATNASTMSVVTATLFPAADVDFFTFGAAPGPLQIVIDLPPNGAVQSSYMAYALTLLDSQFRVVAQAIPPLANPTGGGGCANAAATDLMCQTSASQAILNYAVPARGQYYLQVSAGPTDDGSTSNANSTNPYSLHFSYVQPGALSGSVVTAAFDNDTIAFSANVGAFVGGQNYTFAYAQLRDHAQNVLPQTATNSPSPFLTVVGVPVSAGGVIRGNVRLTPGFAARFPAVGTIHVEVFGLTALESANATGGVAGLAGLAHSLGLSNPLNLAADQAGLTAYNNILTSPGSGNKATFKWSVTSPGHVSIKLYTISGVLVATLIDGDYPGGKGSVDWYGQNSNGQTVASGIYIVHLNGPGISTSQKVIVVK